MVCSLSMTMLRLQTMHAEQCSVADVEHPTLSTRDARTIVDVQLWHAFKYDMQIPQVT